MSRNPITDETTRLKKLGVKIELACLTIQEGEFWLVFDTDEHSDEAYPILDDDGWMSCHAVWQNRDYYTKEIVL